MAVSGSQKTRIGPGVPAVGIAVTILAKTEEAGGRVMSSLAAGGGLAGSGGIAGAAGGLAG